VIRRERLGVGDVEGGAADSLGLEGGNEGVGVDEPAASRVDDDRVRRECR